MTNTPATAPLPLLKHHLDDLRASGLTDDTIRAAGVNSEDDHYKIAAKLNLTYRKARGPAMVFPYTDLDGKPSGHCRIKPTFPYKDKNGRPVKYMSPKGSPNQAYLTPRAIEVRSDEGAELCIVEGEKKALAVWQAGYATIGIPGVFAWKDGKKADRLIPSILAFNLKGRRVYVCFDSDVLNKDGVLDAESRLAAQLRLQGAIVKCLRIPDGPNESKWGADDFLLARGPAEFRKLLDEAKEPEEISDDGKKTHANNVDPGVEAQRFLEQCAHHKDGCTLRFHRGTFWGWDFRRYRERDDNEMRALIYNFLEPTTTNVCRGHVSNILAAINAKTIVPTGTERPCWLDGSRRGKNYLTMENGILDLDAFLVGKPDHLIQHTPNWFTTIALPYCFDPTVTSPFWLKTICRNLDNDPQRIDLVQEIFGYCLSNDTSFQKFFMFAGSGGNGKSVVLAALTAMLGLDNVSHVTLEGFAVRFQLAQTLGKLANIAAEAGEIDKLAEGMLKSFTSGDRMQFERKNKDPIEALPTARLLLGVNDNPRFTDRSSGLWRRMVYVPFNVTIPEDERVYGMDKPHWWQEKGELPGMLNWALEGLRRLRTQGRFTDSELCRKELATYRLECNPARMFLDNHCINEPTGELVTAEIYQRYAAWCGENGYRPMASNTFGKELTRAFPQAAATKVYSREGNRVNGYVGIRIRDDLSAVSSAF